MSRSLRTGVIAIASALLLVGVAGCSSSDDPKDTTSAAKTISTATLKAGDEVPAPKGEPVLTLKGKITNTNVGDTLQFDLATLERLGLREFTADDYQAEGGHVRFRGVLLRDLLDVAGVDAEATTLNTIALNDYKAPVPISDADAYPTLLATTSNGKRMPVAEYGPVRVVYPNLDFEFDKTVYDPRWVWQLATITVD